MQVKVTKIINNDKEILKDLKAAWFDFYAITIE